MSIYLQKPNIFLSVIFFFNIELKWLCLNYLYCQFINFIFRLLFECIKRTFIYVVTVVVLIIGNFSGDMIVALSKISEHVKGYPFNVTRIEVRKLPII